jgi:4-hydroxybenzoate polyprenyltransferase
VTGALDPRGTWRALRHAGRQRAAEVLLLQGAPVLGAAFAGAPAAGEPTTLLATLCGSLLLTAHVFVLNDWAGESGDRNDPRRAGSVFADHGVGSGAMAAVAVVLLAGALLALSVAGLPAVALGGTIACLGAAYSGTGTAAKGLPVVASLLHLFGGGVHFLLGWSAVRPLDAAALAIALFFGLVFAGGHLNQEVRDHAADARNGIRTTAVAFGPRAAWLACFAAFSVAHAELALLAGLGVVPMALVWTALLWPLHLLWVWRALRGAAPAAERACWLQRRYRLLFAVVGLVMVAVLAEPAVRSGAPGDDPPTGSAARPANPVRPPGAPRPS